MEDRSLFGGLLRIFGVVILDVSVLYLVLNKSLFFDTILFPYSLSFIFFALVLINLFLLFYSQLSMRLKPRNVLLPLIYAAFGLLIFALVFTWITYAFITPQTYLIVALAAVLLYAAVAVAVLLRGRAKP